MTPPWVSQSTAAGPFGPPGYPWGPLDMFWHIYLGFFEHIESICFPQKETMPPPKKELSPVSRVKADKRNAQLREKRAATAAPSGGAKSGKKKRKVTDLTEEEMPVSGGGSSSSAPEFCRGLLLDNWKSKELRIAEEKAKFYERSLGLHDSYVKLLEWSKARQVKEIEVLEKENEVLKKKYQDVLDLNSK